VLTIQVAKIRFSPFVQLSFHGKTVKHNTVHISGIHVGEPLGSLAFPWLLKRAADFLGLRETELREI